MSLEFTGKNNATLHGAFFEPVEIAKETYGKSVIFNNNKKAIKFSSEFHDPAFLKYSEIEKVSIIYINKKKYWIWAVISSFFIVGIISLWAIAHLPKWRIVIHLKPENSTGHKKEFISIRARLQLLSAIQLKQLLMEKLEVESKPEALRTIVKTPTEVVTDHHAWKNKIQSESEEKDNK